MSKMKDKYIDLMNNDYGYNEHGEIVESIKKKHEVKNMTTKPTPLELNKAAAGWLGYEWHDYTISDGKCLSTCSCGRKGVYVRDMCAKENAQFDPFHDRNDLDRLVCKLRVFPYRVRFGITDEGFTINYPEWVRNEGIVRKKIKGNYPAEYSRVLLELVKEIYEKEKSSSNK